MEKTIHRGFHEIEERTDTHVDKVAEIIEIWEDYKTLHFIRLDP